jgi:hypothetical protein
LVALSGDDRRRLAAWWISRAADIAVRGDADALADQVAMACTADPHGETHWRPLVITAAEVNG